MTPGQKLQKAFSDTQVTSWVEPLRWEDFGEAAHARYEAAARRFLELIRDSVESREPARPDDGGDECRSAPSQLAELLARVEKATADEQWALVREAAALLLPGGDASLARSQRLDINTLCDAGGYESASLALVERVLPGWVWSVMVDYELPGRARLHDAMQPSGPLSVSADGATPALALLAALLRALISKESS